MSWLCSRALVEAFSEATCSAGAQSALLSGNPTPQAFLPPDKMTAFSRPSRFGMTFGPLTEDLGAELLTWFLADSRARTSVSPAKETGLTESGQASGPKWRGSLARYDPDLRSWKTAQHSLLGDSEEFLETWPRWGTTVAGELYLLPTPAHRTGGNESGLWRTPSAREPGVSPERLEAIKGGELGGMNRHFDRHTGRMAQIGLSQQVKLRRMWQTPVADDAVERKAGKWNSPGEPKLSAEVKLWPTPTKSDGTGGPGSSGRAGGLNLRTAVTVWPTPNASDNRDRGNMSDPAVQRRMALGKQIGLSMVVKESAGSGSLNPTWVELLMGWPAGWTDLQPMDNGEFHDWCKGFGAEGLRDLRADLRAGQVQRAAGGRNSLHEAQALQPFVREQQVAGQDWNAALASAQTPEGCLRGVRLHEAAGSASLRSGPVQQRPVELADVVQPLPRLLARHGQTAWASGRWEDAVPRVAHGVAARMDRLKAIGNGQVPQCAALAWRVLNGP
jgi:hypothetical protein